MPTLGQLISQVRQALTGVSAHTERVAELSADITETALTINLTEDNPELKPGIYEIGFEKIRVKSVNTGVLTAYAFGRGYDATVAADHFAGDQVTFSPLFPAATVLQEINAVIDSLYPHIYSVAVHQPVDPATEEPIGYSWPLTLPSDARGVIGVYEVDDDDGLARLDAWRWEPDAGNQMALPLKEGTEFRVVYARRPLPFDTLNPDANADFAGTTLLPDRLTGLIVTGVAARLAPFLDFARLALAGIEPRTDEGRQVGQGAALGRALQQQFEAGVERESLALAKEHPIRLHRTRG